MRGVILPLVLLIAGCGPQTADKATLAAAEVAQNYTAADDAIPCAAPGGQMRRDCIVERTDGGDDGLVLTVRHPDGAFRRLRVTRDGRGVLAADGAEPATVAVIGDGAIEVKVAGERYQLPATVKANGARK